MEEFVSCLDKNNPFVLDLTRLPRPERSGCYGVIFMLCLLARLVVAPGGGWDFTRPSLCRLLGIGCPVVRAFDPYQTRHKWRNILLAPGHGGNLPGYRHCRWEERTKEHPTPITVAEFDNDDCTEQPVIFAYADGTRYLHYIWLDRLEEVNTWVDFGWVASCCQPCGGDGVTVPCADKIVEVRAIVDRGVKTHPIPVIGVPTDEGGNLIIRVTREK